jgi:NADH:ubiquinone oxidoreductase subunit F (NADH-binding)
VSAQAAQTFERPSPQPSGLPRLLLGLHADRPVSLDEHLAHYGPLRAARHDLIAAVEASGLCGRGGAGFPTGQKLRAVAAQRGRCVVVANVTEGEPVSGKDKALARHAPHLLLDGASAVARALGAHEAIVVVSESAEAERRVLLHAIAARKRAGCDGRLGFRVASTRNGFVSGEETAVVSSLNRSGGKPTFKPPRPFERGVGGAPTLVLNAETLAHVGLIARFGPDWFRSVGTPDEPGSTLVTISGAITQPGVHEIALGTSLRELLATAGGPTGTPLAYLIGGYFGTWVSADAAERLTLCDADLRQVGARLGAGAVVVLPASACGVAETARVARYLADESAHQCGPCFYGLAAIAEALERLAAGEHPDPRPQIERWLGQVSGRGACRHPDGAARFVASALRVFSDEVERHLSHRHCPRRDERVLPIPLRQAR